MKMNWLSRIHIALMMIGMVVLAGCNEDRKPQPVYVEDRVEPVVEEIVIIDNVLEPGKSVLNETCDNRAVVVAISNYDSPSNLESPVNMGREYYDFLIESGFKADNIRVLYDKDATAANVLSCFEWLCEDGKMGDVRAFYYSGHGAQFAGPGSAEEKDRVDEFLYLYGCDWTPATMVTDNQMYNILSRTNQNTMFYITLDACFSGGMQKEIIRPDGKLVKSKQQEPPANIAANIAKAKKNVTQAKITLLTNVCYKFASREKQTSLSIGRGALAYDLFTRHDINISRKFKARYVSTNMDMIEDEMLKEGFTTQNPVAEGNTKTPLFAPNVRIKRVPVKKSKKKTEAESLPEHYRSQTSLSISGKGESAYDLYTKDYIIQKSKSRG